MAILSGMERLIPILNVLCPSSCLSVEEGVSALISFFLTLALRRYFDSSLTHLQSTRSNSYRLYM
jgi:hypothetical protein